jgi:phenylacetic acid degradation operon negative regulatory protein
MKWSEFHHPDISLPVLQRRIGNEFLHFLLLFGEIAITHGHPTILPSLFKDEHVYRTAKYRLRKSGLIVEREGGDGFPRLALSDSARSDLENMHSPDRYWKKKWSGRWYMLMYDVPEVFRQYRDTLRKFLQRMRMGGIQKSVWITPHDIRPEYADLVTTAGVDRFSVLMEAHNVLGRKDADIVDLAWNTVPLVRMQNHYCKAVPANLKLIRDSLLSRDELLDMARAELRAYLDMVAVDPLLPSALHPKEYIGPRVLSLHRKFVSAILKQLAN